MGRSLSNPAGLPPRLDIAATVWVGVGSEATAADGFAPARADNCHRSQMSQRISVENLRSRAQGYLRSTGSPQPTCPQARSQQRFRQKQSRLRTTAHSSASLDRADDRREKDRQYEPTNEGEDEPLFGRPAAVSTLERLGPQIERDYEQDDCSHDRVQPTPGPFVDERDCPDSQYRYQQRPRGPRLCQPCPGPPPASSETRGRRYCMALEPRRYSVCLRPGIEEPGSRP